jgi:hypothetical protein
MPRLVAQLDRMGGQPRLDKHFATHGNGVGLSLGWGTVRWLTPILSEADPRLNHGEPWAEPRRHTLRGRTGPGVQPLDRSDARLAAVLAALSDDARGQACAGALTPHLWRGYDLPPERGRRETTTAHGDWSVTADGRFPLGHRQDQRPDLPQVTVRRSVRDPLGWPVATDVVPGQRAAAPLARPASTRVRARVGRRGVLAVGAGQRGALATRASIQAGGDGSLGPLAETQLPPAVWEGSVTPRAPGQQPLPRLTRLPATSPRPHLADGDERLDRLRAEVAGNRRAWSERRLAVPDPARVWQRPLRPPTSDGAGGASPRGEGRHRPARGGQRDRSAGLAGLGAPRPCRATRAGAGRAGLPQPIPGGQ